MAATALNTRNGRQANQERLGPLLREDAIEALAANYDNYVKASVRDGLTWSYGEWLSTVIGEIKAAVQSAGIPH
jgi:hypothetical protein